MIRRTALLALLPALLLAAGCGSDAKVSTASGNSGSTTIATTPAQVETTTTMSAASQAVLDEINKRGKPTVTVPAAPVTQLQITDDIVGTGDAAKAGDTVTVHYVGVSQSSGKEFDSSWSRGQTATFPLDQVIKGWTDGIPGMKVGGRRTLVIPGDQAYGASPPSPDIAPNDTLVFTIDLVAIG